jgi:hypothetical protein
MRGFVTIGSSKVRLEVTYDIEDCIMNLPVGFIAHFISYFIVNLLDSYYEQSSRIEYDVLKAEFL